MKIYSMTATFGKLEHAELKLQPGLNVIHAPNEWGKSTWCAFLMAMFYGLDTRAKTTKAVLADKQRFQPWSGSPMSGRIDLCWNGRDITIERSSRGRIPMGEFRAYETATGLDIPELTAANCGSVLLGESQNVFRRAGFISLSDLPVTQDDDLRRRLNALVTTGDESGDAERLSQSLRDLRNKCRYNRSGLLPQAEEERRETAEALREAEALETQLRKLKQRQGEVRSYLRELENHMQALSFADAQADAGRVAEARDIRDRETARMEQLENRCAALPSREEAEEKCRVLRTLADRWSDARMEQQIMPDPPEQPEVPEQFEGLDGDEAIRMVQKDAAEFEALKKSAGLIWALLGWAAVILGGGLIYFSQPIYGVIALLAGLSGIAVGLVQKKKQSGRRRALIRKYRSPEPKRWAAEARQYDARQAEYRKRLAQYRASRADLDARLAALENQRESLCGSRSPEQMLAVWEQTVKAWEDYHTARREADRAEKYYETLRSMAKPAIQPAMSDALTYSAADTARLISDAQAEQQRLHSRAGQYQGRLEMLGDPAALQQRLDGLDQRIRKLEDTFEASGIALQLLSKAGAELQRRFAPRISRRAQELMTAMTGGRYDRLMLTEDLSIRAGAKQEDTLHSLRWRSDGTTDQLYLALRLAVAEELMPTAPLILDDALARCDDTRMRAVLDILREMSASKQVILFTCQERETKA